MKRRMQFAVVSAMVALASSPALCDNIVTQTINSVEWRLVLNPNKGTATLGLSGSTEPGWACPKVAVDAADIPWKFTGEDGVQYTVTAVANYAFIGHTDLSGTLTIPSSVTKIGAAAFQKVGAKLTKLKGMEGVTSIGDYAFENATAMEAPELDLSGIASWGRSPLKNCQKLTMPIKLNTSLKSIPANMLTKTHFTGTVVVPESVNTVSSNEDRGVVDESPNIKAVWVKGKATAANQTYTKVHCAKFASSCSSIKVILMGKNTEGARMTQTDSNAMLYGDEGVNVFVPANGKWEGLVAGGTDNNIWYYGPDSEFDLDIDDVNMHVTITPDNATMLVNSLEWATLFKQHFDLEPRISVTNTLDLSSVTITEEMTRNVTFDRLVLSAKTQTELDKILAAFPKSTPVAIDPSGLADSMTIPAEYTNVFVKSAPGVEIKKTAKGLVISLQ